MDGISPSSLTVRASAASCPASALASALAVSRHSGGALETAIRGFSPNFPGHPPAGTHPHPSPAALATAGPQGQGPSGRPAREAWSSPGHSPQPTFSMGEDGPLGAPGLSPRGGHSEGQWSGGPPVRADAEGDCKLGTDGAPVPLLWVAGPPGTRTGEPQAYRLFLAEEARWVSWSRTC